MYSSSPLKTSKLYITQRQKNAQSSRNTPLSHTTSHTGLPDIRSKGRNRARRYTGESLAAMRFRPHLDATKPRSSVARSPLRQPFPRVLVRPPARIRVLPDRVFLHLSALVAKVLKFGAAQSQPRGSADLELKNSVADLSEYLRGVEDGEIRISRSATVCHFD